MRLRLRRDPRHDLPVMGFGLSTRQPVIRAGLGGAGAQRAVRAVSAVFVVGAMLSGSHTVLAQATKGTIAPPVGGRAAPAAMPPVSSDPATTSATYGDWILRCQQIGEENRTQHLCEVVQLIQMQNQRDPIAEIALGRLPHEQVLHLTTVLPPNVSFPSTVRFTASDKMEDGVQLQWRRCLSGGCFADVLPSEEMIRLWRAAAGPGKLTFKDGSGRDVSLPISFRGLAQALDALVKA